MIATREDIENLLKNYPGWKKKITLLEFERNNPSRATELEVLGDWRWHGLSLREPGCLGIFRTKRCRSR